MGDRSIEDAMGEALYWSMHPKIVARSLPFDELPEADKQLWRETARMLFIQARSFGLTVTWKDEG